MGAHWSNHTEFSMWEANWCDRCLHDHPFRSRDVGCGCPILAFAIVAERDEFPPEWFVNDRPYPHDITCIEFKPFGYRKPGPPIPKAPPPGQGSLFDPTIIPWAETVEAKL